MENKIKVAMVIAVIALLIVGFYLLIPQYKEIEMSGYTFEVPNSIAEVKKNTENYNTYFDSQNNLNIKTWSCQNINDMNGTATGGYEMGVQLGENMGNTVYYNNIELFNKSGTYTYFESDMSNACMIIITCDNLDTIEHILETMQKPRLNVDSNLINMPSSDLLIPDASVSSTTTDNSVSSSAESSSKNSDNNNLPADTYSSQENSVSSVSTNTRPQSSSSVQSSSKPAASSGSYSSRPSSSSSKSSSAESISSRSSSGSSSSRSSSGSASSASGSSRSSSGSGGSSDYQFEI